MSFSKVLFSSASFVFLLFAGVLIAVPTISFAADETLTTSIMDLNFCRNVVGPNSKDLMYLKSIDSTAQIPGECPDRSDCACLMDFSKNGAEHSFKLGKLLVMCAALKGTLFGPIGDMSPRTCFTNAEPEADSSDYTYVNIEFYRCCSVPQTIQTGASALGPSLTTLLQEPNTGAGSNEPLRATPVPIPVVEPPPMPGVDYGSPIRFFQPPTMFGD